MNQNYFLYIYAKSFQNIVRNASFMLCSTFESNSCKYFIISKDIFSFIFWNWTFKSFVISGVVSLPPFAETSYPRTNVSNGFGRGPTVKCFGSPPPYKVIRNSKVPFLPGMISTPSLNPPFTNVRSNLRLSSFLAFGGFLAFGSSFADKSVGGA